ncbi:MAG: histidinol-phosphatase [Solobacterium sp.]|nr:histidinol-phosphatase [Solobacterium sp.]
MRQNLHTHSTYCDGKDPLEQMVLQAIKKRFDILGFSGHGPVKDPYAMSIEGTRQYVQEVKLLKEKYKEQIQIYLGVEEDTTNRMWLKEPFEFVIGSVHTMENNGMVLPIDYNRGVLEAIYESWYGCDWGAMAKDYYESVRKMADWEEVDIIGHVDLITKYNEDESFGRFDDPVYVKHACDAVDAFAGKKIMEVNTGAIARGNRKTPYPYRNLLAYMHEKGVQIVLNSDCHDANYLDCHFSESLQMIRECGYTSLMKLTPQGFTEEDIDLFE